MTTEKDLLNLKNEITEANNQVAEIRGQITAVTRQLKDDWACKTIEDAKKKIQSMENESATYQKTIDDGIVELQEKYGIE